MVFDRELLEAQSDLLACRSVESLLRESRRIGMRLTNADDVEIALLRMSKPGEAGQIVYYDGQTPYTPDQVAYLESHSHKHPIFPIAATSGLPVPMGPEDVMGRLGWVNSGIFSEVNKPNSIERSLFATMHVISGYVLWMEAVRHKNSAFRERDRSRLVVLQHLTCALLRRCDHVAELCRAFDLGQKKTGLPAPELSWKVFGLSQREAEVLRWVEAGKQDAEIATILGSGVRTVQTHVSSLLAKLNCENRLQLIASQLGRVVDLPAADESAPD